MLSAIALNTAEIESQAVCVGGKALVSSPHLCLMQLHCQLNSSFRLFITVYDTPMKKATF